MNTLKSSMKISLFAAILSTLTLHVASAAFMLRSDLDDGVNNVLTQGNSNFRFTDGASLKSKVFNVASSWMDASGYTAGYTTTWVENQSGETGYQIAIQNLSGGAGNTPRWNTASLVFKFDAGAGNTFNNGTLSFVTRHMGAWGTNNLTRWRAATFTSEPTYDVASGFNQYLNFSTASQSTFYKRYNNDGLPGSSGNPYENLTLNVPTGVQIFYAAIGSPINTGANDTIRLGGIDFTNIGIVPEPSTYALVVGGIATLLLIRRRVQA